MRLKYQPTEMLKQTPHIVAFLDFLGASEKMRDPAKNDSFLQAIKAVYTRAIEILKITERDQENKLKIKIFSDNVFIGKEIKNPDNSDDIIDAYFDVEQFSFMLYTAAMISGNFMRGAISIGQLYMDDIFVYGEALLNAYKIEEKIACYPRIVIDKSISLTWRQTAQNPASVPADDEDKIHLLDMDGELFLSPFSGLTKVAKNERENEEYLLKDIRQTIIAEYKDLFAQKKQEIFPKYHWLTNKFNEYCQSNAFHFQIDLDKLTLEGEA